MLLPYCLNVCHDDKGHPHLFYETAGDSESPLIWFLSIGYYFQFLDQCATHCFDTILQWHEWQKRLEEEDPDHIPHAEYLVLIPEHN